MTEHEFTQAYQKTNGKNAVQLKQGELIQAGDFYCVLGHMQQDWHRAEVFSHGKKLRDFHRPHFRPLP